MSHAYADGDGMHSVGAHRYKTHKIVPSMRPHQDAHGRTEWYEVEWQKNWQRVTHDDYIGEIFPAWESTPRQFDTEELAQTYVEALLNGGDPDGSAAVQAGNARRTQPYFK